MNTNKEDESGNKVQYVWGLISQSSSIDQQRNAVSLFNVIDQISIDQNNFQPNKAQKIPFSHEIIILWRRASDIFTTEKSLIDAKVALIDPSNRSLTETIFSFQIPEGARRHRHRSQMPGFVITEPGDYVYRVEYKLSGKDSFEEKREIPFEVRRVSPSS